MMTGNVTVVHPRTGVVMSLHPSVAHAAHWIDERNVTDADARWDVKQLNSERFARAIARLAYEHHDTSRLAAQQPHPTPEAGRVLENGVPNAS